MEGLAPQVGRSLNSTVVQVGARAARPGTKTETRSGSGHRSAARSRRARRSAVLRVRTPAEHQGAELSAIRSTIEAPSFQSALEDDVTRSLVAVEGIYSVAHGTVATDLTDVDIEMPNQEHATCRRGSSCFGDVQVREVGL